MPFFSIVIPVYNREDLLTETLQSIKNQSFTDWECIVVDDGSTDGTVNLMKQESLLDNRFKYIYQDNAERSAARNNGSENAQGEYICFLDSDDKYVESYLQILHDKIKATNYLEALFISDFCIWDGMKVEVVDVPLIQKPIADWLFHFPVSPSRACVHKNILCKYKFREDIVIVEDTVLWVSIANEYQVIQVKHPLVWYRVHEGNSVHEGTKSAFDRYKGMKKFFLEPESEQVSKQVKKEMLSDVKFRMAEYYRSTNNNFQALKECFHSIIIQ